MNLLPSHLWPRTRHRLRALLSRHVSPGTRYASPKHNRDWGSPEAEFQAVDGTRLPVSSDYRYAIKKGWTFCEHLLFLSQLQTRKLASPEDTRFFLSSIGQRTIARPLEEIEAYIRCRMTDLEPHLIPASRNAKTPRLKPENRDTQQRIQYFVRSHRNLLSDLQKNGIASFSKNQRLLEIGFESGGHSLFAFEHLGFQVSGVDNGYSGLVDANPLPDYLKTQTGSHVSFHHGDITQETAFPASHFDVIYSASVLEHIQRIPEAFREMHRLLKPGGLIIHKYHPFFCPSGGHVLGILDAPWGHCRLSEQDYLRYIHQYRPYEAESAEAWIGGALTRAYPIAAMQRAVSEAHFDIALWRETDIPEAQLADLTPDITRECFRVNPHIGLSDLISESILLVAKKPG